MTLRHIQTKLPQSELDRRRALCTPLVTLDGKPARVGGAFLRYPKVTTLDLSQTIEFSWGAVKRIMENDKAFRS